MSKPFVGALTDVHTSQLNELGSEVTVASETYVYLKGVTSLADGDWVSYRAGTWTAVRLAASAKGSVGIAQAAVDAATKYGWFKIVGSDTAVCESSIVSNANCYAMATAGRVDDAIVKNDQVKRAVTTTAGVAGGTATVSIDRPYIGSNDESA